MKYFKEGVLKHFKIFMKFLNISKWNISSCIPSSHKEPYARFLLTRLICWSPHCVSFRLWQRMLTLRGRAVTLPTSTSHPTANQWPAPFNSRRVNSSATSTSVQQSFFCLKPPTHLSLPFDRASAYDTDKGSAARQTNILRLNSRHIFTECHTSVSVLPWLNNVCACTSHLLAHKLLEFLQLAEFVFRLENRLALF